MKAPKSQQQLLLEAVWKKAYARTDEEGPLICHFANKSAAVRARMALYNAVRKAKRGEDSDYDLVQAAQNLEISYTGEASFALRRIDRAAFISGLEEALGETIGSMEDPAIAEARRQIEAMETAKPVLAPATNVPDWMPRR